MPPSRRASSAGTLDATHKSGTRWRVEVTRVSGALPSAFLTANEHKAAADHPDWTLAVVTSSLSTPPSALEVYTGSDAIALAEPQVCKALMLAVDACDKPVGG